MRLDVSRLRAGATRAWIANALLLLIGIGLVCLSRQLVAEFQGYSIGYSGVSGWSVLLYAAAVLVVLTQPSNRYTFPLILTIAIACRLAPLMAEAAMSSDIYRYAWDGVVQHAHINPYRYAPGDAALSFLRQPNQDLFDNINRRDYAHTIYPPAAQVFFFAVTWLNGSMLFMKLSMVLMEGVTLWALLQMLKDLGRPSQHALLYAWCPLLVWEIGSSGHIDSLMMAFMMLTLLFRLRQKPGWCGFFFALCVLTKFFPLVLFPALFQRRALRMPAVAIATALALYACYSSVGLRVFGFLTSGYAAEEGMESGSRYFFLEAIRHVPGMSGLPNAVFLVVMLGTLAALAVLAWHVSDADRIPVWFRSTLRSLQLPQRAGFLVPSAVLTTVAMLFFSPHYPWYLCWLVPLFALMPVLTLFSYFCGLFYLCATPLGAGTPQAQYALNRILYAAVFAAAALDVAGRAAYARLSNKVTGA